MALSQEKIRLYVKYSQNYIQKIDEILKQTKWLHCNHTAYVYNWIIDQNWLIVMALAQNIVLTNLWE